MEDIKHDPQSIYIFSEVSTAVSSREKAAKAQNCCEPGALIYLGLALEHFWDFLAEGLSGWGLEVGL